MGMTTVQADRLKLWYENGQSFKAVADILNLNPSSVTKSIKLALEWKKATPGQLEAMKTTGLDIANASHGWRVKVHPDGSRDSVFWKIQRVGVDPINVAQALTEELQKLPRAAVSKPPKENLPQDLCNFIPLADLHVGGEYGDPKYFTVVLSTLEQMISALPKAKKAVLLDMGDLLDANDHKGLTPASGNECDVIRENHLQNTIDALNIMRYATSRLLQTHEEVEVHLLRGNHDETAYIGVMVALDAHFKDDPRVNVVVSDNNFRVINWGKCGIFPHHGDKAKWEDLKSVFSDQFPSEWAKAKYWRFIWTAHVHHDKQRQLIGADAEHFRTLAQPNNWAMMKGLFSRGGIQGITLHKEDGEVGRTKRNLKPLLLQDKPRKTFMS